jgi:hypothetical protein
MHQTARPSVRRLVPQAQEVRPEPDAVNGTRLFSRSDPQSWSSLIGLAAIVFSILYLVSDLIEVAQGGFSTERLAMTYAAEAAIPLFVPGLYLLQRPSIGRLGLLGAFGYAYSYVFFTGTVLYALVATTPDYEALAKTFGTSMTIHGLVMLVGGLAFGLAVVRARVLPRWTGICLMAGVIAVAAASGFPTLVRATAEAFPAVAFTGMGWAALARPCWRGGTARSPAAEANRVSH